MKNFKIKKAVFPVAGLGSRFLPATKAQPKEMLTLVDKPLIQYAVEEAVAAGITELIFITGRNKRAIEDHFDTAYELESELEAANKTALLELVQNVIPKTVSCIYIRQPAALGLGHAVLCAKPVVGNDPFAVILADDFMLAGPGCKNTTEQMIEIYEQEQSSIVAVQDVPREQTKQYGVVSVVEYKDKLDRILAIVEKPSPETAPSTKAVVGRYILDAQIFSYLANIGKGSGGEIQLTDGISAMLADHRFLSYRFAGTRYDCGSKLGYLKASMKLGTMHNEIGNEFKQYLNSMMPYESGSD